MRVFDHPNMEGFVCPICKTSEDKPVVLIGIASTAEGGIMQARQYHLECIELFECTAMSTTYLVQEVSHA